jgi:hypothetical protein
MTDTDWLDPIDAEILREIGEGYRRLDPPPADLDERVRFAIALENIDVEVSRLQGDQLLGSGARGPERVRTITFDSASLTIMVTIADTGGNAVRLDGWLAPAGRLQVELRTADTTRSRMVMADDTGRFVFEGVGHGLAQVLVHQVAGSGVDLAATVVTPSLTL